MFRLIFNTILLASALGLFFMYIKPNYSDNDKSIVALRKEEKNITDTFASLKALEEKQQDLSAKRNEFASRPDGAEQKLDRMLPTQINPVLLIMELNTVAADYGMTIKNLKFESRSSEPTTTAQPAVYHAPTDYRPFNVIFSVDGSYDKFVNFIRSLESNLRTTDVLAVTLTANDKSDIYQYSVKITTYSVQ